MAATAVAYKPLNPKNSDYYRCVEDHLKTFIRIYEERFERTYEFFRPYLQKVIYCYLNGRDLQNGFAHMKCRLQLVILTSIPKEYLRTCR